MALASRHPRDGRRIAERETEKRRAPRYSAEPPRAAARHLSLHLESVRVPLSVCYVIACAGIHGRRVAPARAVPPAPRAQDDRGGRSVADDGAPAEPRVPSARSEPVVLHNDARTAPTYQALTLEPSGHGVAVRGVGPPGACESDIEIQTGPCCTPEAQRHQYVGLVIHGPALD